MSAFSRIRDNLKIAVLTTAITAASSFSIADSVSTGSADFSLDENARTEVQSAYASFLAAQDTLSDAAIEMMVSESQLLVSPESAQAQVALMNDQEAYRVARLRAQANQDRLLDIAADLRAKGYDFGGLTPALESAMARDLDNIDLKEIEAAVHQRINQCENTSTVTFCANRKG